jgi:RNA polymerase-binding transcription factor DksA
VSEHKEIDDYLEEMEEQDFNGKEWRETFAQLKKRYLHHIDEDEEEMFPDAAKDLTAEEEKTLGAKFAERKPAELERAKAED